MGEAERGVKRRADAPPVGFLPPREAKRSGGGGPPKAVEGAAANSERGAAPSTTLRVVALPRARTEGGPARVLPRWGVVEFRELSTLTLTTDPLAVDVQVTDRS